MQFQVINSIILHYLLLFLLRFSRFIQECLHGCQSTPECQTIGSGVNAETTPQLWRSLSQTFDPTCRSTTLPLFERLGCPGCSYYGHGDRHIPVSINEHKKRPGRISQAGWTAYGPVLTRVVRAIHSTVLLLALRFFGTRSGNLPRSAILGSRNFQKWVSGQSIYAVKTISPIDTTEPTQQRLRSSQAHHSSLNKVGYSRDGTLDDLESDVVRS